jgi:hypothetical protein
VVAQFAERRQDHQLSVKPGRVHVPVAMCYTRDLDGIRGRFRIAGLMSLRGLLPIIQPWVFTILCLFTSTW